MSNTAYVNTSESWGDNCLVDVATYRSLAGTYGVDADKITADDDGIYYDGEKIAQAVALMDYDTNEEIRRATPDEQEASIEAARHDGGVGAIEVDGRTCYVA